MREKLKKYSPLGLLALAVLAGVVAFIQHQENEDAGYDVVTYLNCEEVKENLITEMVIIREGDGFEVLEYDPKDAAILGRGEPKDLSYFSRVPIRKFTESPLKFKWEETIPPNAVVQQGQIMEMVLNRTNGILWRTYGGRKANTSGCGGFLGCRAVEQNTRNYLCSFGEEAKKLVWVNTVADYKRKAPKF